MFYWFLLFLDLVQSHNSVIKADFTLQWKQMAIATANANEDPLE